MSKIKKYSDVIILSIIWMVSIYSMITMLVNSYEMGIRNYIGYSLLVGMSMLRLSKVKRYNTFLGIFLIVGSINAFQFTYATNTLVFYWTPLEHELTSFGIQPLSSLLLLLLLVINFSEWKRFINDLFSEDPKAKAEIQKSISEKYYRTLRNEKDAKWQEIIDNPNKYQIEYVAAAQRLLDEKKQV